MRRESPPLILESTFRTVLDNTQAVVFIKDLAGRYLYTNLHYQKIFHLCPKDVLGKTDFQIFPRKVARAFRKNDAAVIKSKRPLSREEEAFLADGKHTWISVKFPLKDARGRLAGVCGIATDITRQKQSEEALRESEERCRLFSESAKDLAFVILDEKGRVRAWDSGSERLRGYTAKEVMGKHFRIFFRQKDRRAGLPEKMLRKMARLGQYEYEGIRRRKDGSLFWIRQTLRVLRDEKGRIKGYATVSSDGTERRRILRMATASRHLIEGEELERKRVARELHDGLNQTLSSAKTRLLALEKPSVGPSVRLLETAISEVRRISRNLRPALLDDLGLLPALRGLCEDLRKSAGLACSIDATGFPRSLHHSLEVTVYRLIQEAVANVVRHAHATRLDIRLARTKMGLDIQVRDNGRGFRPGRERPGRERPGGSGLINMRDRAELCGGRLHVKTRPGQGTTLHFFLPASETPGERPS